MSTVTSTHYDELIELARPRLDDFQRMKAAGLVCKSGDFYPSVHYPPITMYPRCTEEELFRTYTLPRDGMFDVYIHLPFCHHHCIFCHYPVKLGPQLEEKERYLKALEKEMDLYMRRLGVSKIKPRSILVGGGTPTYLTIKQLEHFLKFFTSRMDMAGIKQFNYDVDPTTLVGPEGLDRLRLMRDYGVDRLTIGVQSLNDSILRKMNRDHNAATAIESIRNCQEFGYQVNIEFIFGYPSQTIKNWIDLMQKAVTLGVEEIQLYRLKVEAYGDYQGTIKKYKQIRPQDVPCPDDSLLMKQLAIIILNQNGYTENLRRVFSRQKKHFSVYAHNQCCNLQDEIGIGLTAFSSLRDRFGLNTQSFEEYYQAIDEDRLPLNRGLVRSQDEQTRWGIILPIKNRDIRKRLYQRVTGASLDKVFRTKIQNLKSFGLVEEDANSLGVTTLGAFFADEVAQQFQSARYMAYPQEAYENGPLNPFLNNDPDA